ncbi:MAG: cytochrome-c oxidase, cbb3-type subunit III [Steroidobacteraceae bacterium]
MSGGWSLYVAAISVANIVAVLWLLWWMRRGRDDPSRAGPQTTGHTWDGDLREYNNPLPRWWLWLFIVSIAFAVAYLVAYPGLGNYAGTLGWSSQAQHAEQAAASEALIQQTLAPFRDRTVEALAADPAALRVGRNLFVNNCVQCHGSDGRGAPGFPNLTDGDWLWGSAPETVVTTITQGRTAVMAPWKAVLGERGVEDVLAYVLSLSGRSAAAGDLANGKQKFGQICAACHGADGRGNQQLGAPNLADNIWLYGGTATAIRETVSNGRQGIMPAQGDRLGPVRIKLLAAYVESLNQSRHEAAQSGTGGS